MEVVWHHYNNPAERVTSEVVTMGKLPSGFANTPATPYVVVRNGAETEVVSRGQVDGGSAEVLRHLGKRLKDERTPRLAR